MRAELCAGINISAMASVVNTHSIHNGDDDDDDDDNDDHDDDDDSIGDLWLKSLWPPSLHSR